MAGWMRRLLLWASGARAQAADPRAPQSAPDALASAQVHAPAAEGARLSETGQGQAETADLELRFFEWLVGDALAAADTYEVQAEARILAHMDAVSRSDEQRADLLPRARAVIPELLHSLRDDTQSMRALSARVARDPNLVVEVIRLANTVGYRPDNHVADLMQAVSRLGTEGLRRAIARVLLKPIFDAQADPLLGRATQRLWQHSELKASVCLQGAAGAGLDPFESYLAGLIHNVGWTAALRVIDRSPAGRPRRFSPTFVHALVPRRDRLFALLVGSWQLSDALTSMAQEVLAVGSAHARQPLAQLLVYADRVACQQLLQAAVPSSPSTDSAGV